MNFFISIFTIFFIFTAVESVFCYLIIFSDGFELTLCSDHWFQKYWNPINSYGYRDIEHTSLQGKKIVFVVGDSFVTGHGIKDYKDRFSDVLSEKLTNEWDVVNIAQNGWNTSDEYAAIVSFPCKPDYIVLSHYLNDIDGAAAKTGFFKPEILARPPGFINFFISRSYFLNILYWAAYKVKNGKRLTQEYYKYLLNAYGNETIWNIHKEEIIRIIDYADNIEAVLIVIVFPHIMDMKNSKIFTDKVIDFLKFNRIKFIDMLEIIADEEPNRLIVSTFDTHPNEKVHRDVGILLYDLIMSYENGH